MVDRKKGMAALNIKDPEVHDLAKELARRTGRSLTDAVKEALKEGLAQARSRQTDQTRLVGRVMEIARLAASRPVLDSRSDEEILGYDESGIPR